jgi:3-oxoacyl-[acyl-carrier protein] reductase
MNAVSFDFTNSNVLVTGGTSRIGNAIANAFAKAGANVTVTGTRASADDYSDDLSVFTYYQCQLSDPASVDALVESLGNLDILVNNAGANAPGGKDEWDPDGYVVSVALNMIGPMRLTMGCHERLKASNASGGASVINIVSMSAFRSAVSVPGYASSKAGLVALTMNLGRRWVGDGIRVNAVAPGLIDTRMTHRGMSIPQVMDVEIGFHTPMGRPGTPEDCVGAVLFLCCDAASYITGASFAVDGGYLAV